MKKNTLCLPISVCFHSLLPNMNIVNAGLSLQKPYYLIYVNFKYLQLLLESSKCSLILVKQIRK